MGCKDKHGRKKPCAKTMHYTFEEELTPEGQAAANIFNRKHGAWSRVINQVGLWHDGMVRDFVTFYEFIEETGISIQDVKDWLMVSEAEKMGKMNEKQAYMNLFWKFQNQRFSCPECGFGLSFEPVNHIPPMMVGGNYKFRIYCNNVVEGCEWDTYIRSSVEDWISREKKKRAHEMKEIIKTAQGVPKRDRLTGGIIYKDKLQEAEERVGNIIRKRQAEEKLKKEKEKNAKG